ncbi:dual specificity protein phosphatase 19 [Prorops nasuta]|uniref:dual specificity protein phosphatase 19 n=1 Tax=Prorops nasuta TaxID=863751 RepID=UPI0034CD692C
MNLQNLIQQKKLTLKHCKTIITDEEGTKYEIINGEKKEISKGLPFVLDTKPDLNISCILPGLFLSSQDPATTIDILKQYNIHHILSIGVDLDIKFNGIQYYKYDLLDLPESDLLPSMKSCIEIINNCRKENILVHCNAGVSRSPSLIILYLMVLEKIPYEEAFEKVKSTRKYIRPNDGFVRQMKMFDFSNFNL